MTNRRPSRTRYFVGLFLWVLVFQSADANAAKWSLGVLGGFGGAGMVKGVTVEDTSMEVERSEGPAVVGISVETLLSDRWNFSIDHRRGVRLGPFSSGVGFTGVNWRWYFLRGGLAPIGKEKESYIYRRAWSPFAGVSVGIANGTINREEDIVSNVSTSGMYVGTRFGVDYLYKKWLLLRPEITYSTTLMNASTVPSSMSEFSINLGCVFPMPF